MVRGSTVGCSDNLDAALREIQPNESGDLEMSDAKKCPPQSNLNAVGTVLTKRSRIWATDTHLCVRHEKPLAIAESKRNIK